MAFTNDWTVTSNPADHSKFKEAPGFIRKLRTDIEERIKNILSGFVSGETFDGIKKAKLLTYGTGTPTAPLGTGTEASYDLYGITTGGQPELFGISSDGALTQFSKKGKVPLENARIKNDTYLTGRNYADSADVNIFKINTGNSIEFATHPIAPNTGPTTTLQYAPKGYIDPKFDITTGHDHDGTDSKLVSGQLGAWVERSNSTVYQATVDGFVLAYGSTSSAVDIYGWTDSSNPPTTVRARQTIYVTYSTYGLIILPVKKNDYWKVEINSGFVYWIPLGS